jgi:DNA mismatch repair protein MutS
LKSEFEKKKIELENGNNEIQKLKAKEKKSKQTKNKDILQMSFDVLEEDILREEILSIDLMNMTPMEAMNALFSLQKKAKDK